MTMDAWIAAVCEELDVPIDDVDVSAILDLARDAAHTIERPAAPVTAFVAGYSAAAKGGGSAAVDTALAAAGDLITRWSQAEMPSAPEGSVPLDGAGETPAGDAPDTPESGTVDR